MPRKLVWLIISALMSNLLFAEVPISKKRGDLVFLDPGHGGKDQGTANKEFRYEEKSLALSFAISVQNHLKRLGYRVVLTRSTDVYVPLSKRVALANQAKADVFVSLHCNYSANSAAFGTEIYFYNDKNNILRTRVSEQLGQIILASMQRHGSLKNRAVKPGNFAVIRETKMPAVLVETGFLSNPRERTCLLDTRYRMHLSKGIAEGIHQFMSLSKERTAVGEAKTARLG